MKTAIDGLPERSILYISANVHASHAMFQLVRAHIDPLPDLDLARISRALGPWARKYFAERVIDATSEDLPSDISKYRGIVVGCSAHSVNTDRGELAPWQSRLIAFVRRAILEHDRPFLGLCGGGQIGFAALGGKVRENPAGIGFTPERRGSMIMRTTEVSLTAEGRAHPIFEGCPEKMGIQALHSEYLAEIPPDPLFRVLAQSRDLPNQVLAYGEKVALFGLHPELTSDFLQETSAQVVEGGGFASVPRLALREAFAAFAPTKHANVTVLQNFLSRMCTRSS